MVPLVTGHPARLVVFASFILIVLVSGCSPKAGDMVVATVGDTPITLSDYENLYIKSNGTREQAAESTSGEREEFLRLMTNFRLKLADAYSSGLDRRPEILAEIKQYRGSLAASYLTEREVTAPGVRKLYNRRTEEIRASHILISLAPEASPEDSAVAYGKAADIIRRLNAGTDFAAQAEEFSQDPSVKQNHGDLYYFTGGQMVPGFEDAAFAMKVGEISRVPVRTQYGLHILRITDRKPAPGEVQASHIMIRFERQDPTPEDTLAALAKITAIRDSIAMGVDFAELAMRNSGDPGSAQRGGDLGWFTRRRWIQSFDEVAVLMKPGEVSRIVRTIYGYHIIKCTDARPPKSLEESRKDLTQLYQQVRFQEDYRKYLDSLKRSTGFTMVESAAGQLTSSLDSTRSTRDSAWADAIPAAVRSLTLFRFGDRGVSVDSVLTLIRNRPDMGNVTLRAASLRQNLDKIAEQLVYEIKAQTIEREYPEFGAIMKEYSEGILLYQVEQDRIWSRIAVSDSALRGYHAAHAEQFRFPDRLAITTIRMANDSTATVVAARLRAGESMEDLARADSIRMSRPTSTVIPFRPRSVSLSRTDLARLATVAAELADDPSLRLVLLTNHDTTRTGKTSEKLAQRRLDAISAHLTSKLHVASSRITAQTRPHAHGPNDSLATLLTGRVSIEIVGRQPLLRGTPETELLPTDADERTAAADSLQPGTWSPPFRAQGGLTIVRLDRREPARTKTFEEAGTEVSSAFQDYESKRLEQEWLDGLRVRFPVVSHPEVLKNAFATTP